jgi:hypothetical protein
MDTIEISIAVPASEQTDAPVELLFARHQLMKLGMYTRYSPQSARYLRECIAHELERAEKVLRERLACPAVEKHRKEILEARQALELARH